MKNIILLLAIALFFSCRKENDNPSSNNTRNTTISFIDNFTFGDSLISNYEFVNQLKNNTDIKSQRINLSKIKFEYEKFNKWDLNINEEFNVENINLKFKKNKEQKPDTDIYTHISLYTYKNNKKIDELIVFKEENYSEALVAINEYFYLDSTLNLWTLEISEDEEGIKVISWNQYKIDNKSGKINLSNNNIFNNSSASNNKNSNNWTGKYYFEKSNRDDLKTSFKITINNLNDISIIYASDGEKPEIYNGIVGKMIDKNKIEIVFNKKYDEMGIIYLQNDKNDYIISGTPISTINPGNDEYPLKKIE
nr:hypothetical protein [uncultured Flavobacterium sp.]